MAAKKNLYDLSRIEKKWQEYWEKNKTFRAIDCEDSKPKYYVLDMFPYPSGEGIHAGHVENYTASDIAARYKRMRGFNVLHPIGWDAFGLPAEQYAVKSGTNPAETTQKNISNMRRQIKSMGFSYDWDRQVDTTDPGYYKWTQWIFLKIFNSFFDRAEQKAKPIEELQIPEGLNAEQRRQFIEDNRLAYQARVPVNWCPALGTVLANEEVIGGLSERGGHPVIRKPMRQWMLRITKYAERLLEDLRDVDWPESIKKLQIDWIGKSVGADVDFRVARASSPCEHGQDGRATDIIRVFTTRPDTLFGATYMVLAPEVEIVDKITTDEQKEAVKKYREEAARKSDLDRTDLAKEKTGVFTGAYAINPVNEEKIPIWISDYVLISYGTGAIMSVPAHDERDYEFALKFGLPIIPVVEPDRETALLLPIPSSYSYDGPTGEKVTDEEWNAIADSIIEEVRVGRAPFTIPVSGKLERQVIDMVSDDSLAVQEVRERLRNCILISQCTAGEGWAINSGQFNGLSTAEFKEKITSWLTEKGLGQKAINYKLRDWLFSRQRYWGEPFPILHTEDGITGLSEKELPLELPKVESYKPAGDGQSPLANISDWVEVTMPDGRKARRETNTMPQWAGSCWYYLRYLDAKNDKAGWESEKERYWMPVDLYIGGAEHAVLHLLYARFWHKVLYDLGYTSTKEPFKKLVNQGMILGEDGQKMSKSRGNVVNPDHVTSDYGADSMRLYEMFMGPLEATKPWNMQGVEGVYRFLQRTWRITVDEDTDRLCPEVKDAEADEETLRLLHKTIKKVTEDIESFAFNTAISAMMIFINHLAKQQARPRSLLEKFVLILSPFAPHIAEELWAKLGRKETLAYEPWPQFDEKLVQDKQVELAVQVNGKIKDRIVVSADTDEDQIKQKALSCEKVADAIAGREPRKIFVVKERLVNIVC